MARTRAQEIAFVSCPALAKSFNCESQHGWPNLKDIPELSILGEPYWSFSEATPWSELLVPNVSFTDYIMVRLKKPRNRDVVSLISEGLSPNVASRLLEETNLLGAKLEANRVQMEMDAGGKITQVGTLFKRRNELTAVLAAARTKTFTLKRTAVKEVHDSISNSL